MAKPRRTRNYPHLRRQATARAEREQERAMFSITSASDWTCQSCGTRVKGHERHECLLTGTAYPADTTRLPMPLETVDYAETIKALRAERDAARLSLEEVNECAADERARGDAYRRRALALLNVSRFWRERSKAVHWRLGEVGAERDAALAGRDAAKVLEMQADEERRQAEQERDAATTEAARLRALLARAREEVLHDEDCEFWHDLDDGCDCGAADLRVAIDAALAQPGGAEGGPR